MATAVRVIDRIRDQSDFQGPLTDGQFLRYELDTDRFLLDAPAAGLITGVTDTPTVDLTVAGGALSAAVLAQMSIAAAGALSLVNDVASPGNNALYGTDQTGARGWYPQPTSSVEGIWSFNTTTTMADPGSGKVRANNAAAASTTQMALDTLTDSGIDATQTLSSLASGDGVYVQDKTNAAVWARYTLSAAPTNNTGWFLLPVTYQSGAGGAIGNNDKLLFSFTRAAGVGGGGAPGGSSGQLQYNNAGAFGGAAAAAYATSGSLLTLTAQAATDKPLVVKGAGAQSANLQEWRDSLGTARSYVDPAGRLVVGDGATALPNPGAPVMLKTAAPSGSIAWAMRQNAARAGYPSLIYMESSEGTLAYLGGSPGGFQILAPAGLTVELAANFKYNAPQLVIGPAGTTTLSADGAANVGLVVKGKAAQTADLQQWQDSGGVVLSAVSENGYFMTRKTAAPADAELQSGELAIWLDQSVGATKVMFKAKDSAGTVRTASLAMT